MNKKIGFGKGQANAQKKIDIKAQLDEAMLRIGALNNGVAKR